MAAHDHLTPAYRALVASARAAAEAAYAPYSGFRVGAAALGSSGRVFGGCNVENASYPVTLCAERSAVAAAVAPAEQRIVAVAVAPADESIETVTPCGMCRQFLAEFGPELTVVSRQEGLWVAQPVGELLPAAFSLSEAAASPAAGTPTRPVSGETLGIVGPAPPLAGASRVELRRVARPGVGQLEQLARLELEVFGHTGLRAEDLSVVSRAGAVYEGRVDGQLVGSCQLLRVFDEPTVAWVVGFYVVPVFRGEGYGREFLAAVAAEAGDAGFRRLVLTVGMDNTPALELYLSFGFAEVETIPDFYGPGEDRLLLGCDLGRADRVRPASGLEPGRDRG